ncbi:hypothetical protein DDE82_007490 [Stemphylium lycopersici]|uniref:Uncharacterized protein n=1 Tax=Stemphylium lycopersici TaxID=183478 RepID=A0A364N8Q1_STELY|nr:hypothetical protein TW65_07322 [Stemphylium lycopersici]RAR00248.1 hypothetical protein DDE82_007490 [Stemphylium lycopersici]RAR13411.1 hypothetical protein DDE83_003275 [Stemphylium lycopersici]
MSTTHESSPSTSSTSETTPSASLNPLTSHGLHLQVTFLWTKFRNEIAIKGSNGTLTPLYIMHRRPLKPQLRYERVSDTTTTTTTIGTGSINTFSIDSTCTLHAQEIHLKPLKRWKTQYNYLSHALGGIPLSWIANSTLKEWDFVCVNSVTQEPVAKFSVNWWAVKEVGNFYFDGKVREGVRDEIVVTGLTLLYVMTTRMNNPFHLLGAAFARPGKVEEEGMEMRDGGGKMKVA